MSIISNIMFAKIKADATIPSKRNEDAGYDIYACFDDEEMVIPPLETVKIPTGIISAFPDVCVGIVKERGSLGSKGVSVRCGVIDSGFRGEWFVAMTNHNNVPLVITKRDASAREDTASIEHTYGKAIAQVIFLPTAQLSSVQVPAEKIQGIESQRGTGMLGSSGK
jgi:dUTP pyrophosphatase